MKITMKKALEDVENFEAEFKPRSLFRVFDLEGFSSRFIF